MKWEDSVLAGKPMRASMDAVTLAERINELVAQHGSLNALARVMKCSPPYICRLRSGVTNNPGPAVLRKLGLRRVVSYERIKPPNAGVER